MRVLEIKECVDPESTNAYTGTKLMLKVPLITSGSSSACSWVIANIHPVLVSWHWDNC